MSEHTKHATRFPHLTTFAVALACLMACITTTTSADLISIDLTAAGSPVYVGDAPSQSGNLVPLQGQVGAWNNLDLGGNFSTVTGPLSVINALNGNGNPTNVDFFLNTTSAPFLTAFSGNGDPDTLGSDIIFSTNNSVVGWRFEDLSPNGLYQIRFFGQVNGGSNASFTHFTSAAATPTTVTTTNAQNFVDLFAMADEFGMIAGTFTRFEPSPMTGTSSLSAVQIQFIPEPGAVMVLGALGLSLLGGRNGRRTAA